MVVYSDHEMTQPIIISYRFREAETSDKEELLYLFDYLPAFAEDEDSFDGQLFIFKQEQARDLLDINDLIREIGSIQARLSEKKC